MEIIPRLLVEDNPAPSKQQKNDFGNFVVTKYFSYNLLEEKKVARVYFISEIPYDLSGFILLINLIMSLPESFTLHMYINSPGGAIDTCCTIMSALKRCKAQVITHNMGIAASCGSLLLSAGEKIHIAPQATTMFHAPASGGHDYTSRVIQNNKHVIDYIEHIMQSFVTRGLLLQEEFDGITKRNMEYYISADIMTSRIKDAGMWYEGGV